MQILQKSLSTDTKQKFYNTNISSGLNI